MAKSISDLLATVGRPMTDKDIQVAEYLIAECDGGKDETSVAVAQKLFSKFGLEFLKDRVAGSPDPAYAAKGVRDTSEKVRIMGLRLEQAKNQGDTTVALALVRLNRRFGDCDLNTLKEELHAAENDRRLLVSADGRKKLGLPPKRDVTTPEQTEAPAAEQEQTEAPAAEQEQTEAPATEPEQTEAPATEPKSKRK